METEEAAARSFTVVCWSCFGFLYQKEAPNPADVTCRVVVKK